MLEYRSLGQTKAVVLSQTRIGFWLLSVFAGLLLLSTAPATGAPTVQATLDRDIITLGESATLSITFSGGKPKAVPTPPAVPNLQMVPAGESSQISMAPGQVISTTSYNFRVVPRQAGDYVIPAMSITVEGKALTTPQLTLKVVKPDSPSAQALNSGKELVFLKLIVPKKQLYLGESTVVQLQLYLRQGVQNISDFQISDFPAEGALVGKMAEANRTQAQVGNAIYTVIPLVYPVKALRAGPLQLGPVAASAVLQLPSQNRRRDPFAEQFGMRGMFDSFFGGSEQRQFAFATEAETLEILPLPKEGVPPGFNGAVGTFGLTATVGPTNVAVGDPITVKIALAGRGAIDSLEFPEQPGWSDFKTYPPTTKLEPADALGLSGTKHFEQVIIPEKVSITAVPPITFSFFDPEAKTYRTVTHPATPLVVRPAGALPLPSVAAGTRTAEESPPPAQDIVHIKQRLGVIAQVRPPLMAQPWFLALQSVPILAYFAAVAWRRRSEKLAHNPRLRRQRETARIIREGLAELRTQAADNNSEAFFATVSRLLQEQLGERLDVPASAITEAVIDERLRPLGVPEPVLAQLHDLFQTCNLARFAPIKSSQELAAFVPKTEAALEEVRRITA